MMLLPFRISRLLSVSLVMFSVTAIAQPKNYPSLLWEISGSGLQKPSYLYGTMHVSSKVAFHLTDAFFEALDRSEVVALESNPETWLGEIMEEGTNMMSNRMFRNLYGFGSAGFYENAFGIKLPTNKFIRRQISVEPEDVNGLLYRYHGYSGNFEECTYLDLFVFQSARKAKKDVLALEDFRTSLVMLSKASLPDKDADNAPAYFPPFDIGQKIEDAYRRGDLDLMDSLDNLSNPSKNFRKYMLTERNIIMANNMDSIMKIKSLFSAIGAAHLPGDDGVIKLLRAKGYTVKPVMSEVTKKSIKTMSSIEQTHTPLIYTTQYAADSSFKVDVPGKMYATTGMDQIDSYLHTDMVNGSYYMVKKIKVFGTMAEQDAEYQWRRVDSMLYENIPGKILSRKKVVSNTGIPGMDVVNKTRRGDYQHYRIYTAADYIYIFKVSGTGEYVKGKETERFFKSITMLESPAKNWTIYKPSFGGYELNLPAGYILTTPKLGTFKKEVITANEGANFYHFTRSILSDYYYIEEDTFELSQLANEYCEALGFEIQDKKFGTYERVPSADVVAKKKGSGAYLHMRLILKDQQYFMLSCRSNEKNPPLQYFNSLKFSEFRNGKMEEYVDTAFYYSVMTDYKEPKSGLMESLTSSMRGMYAEKAPAKWLSSREDKIIESPGTGEAVQVYKLKCGDYRMDADNEAFWKPQIEHYKNTTSLNVRSKKFFEKDGAAGLDLILEDTNSVKQIHTRMLHRNGMLYILHTNVDTIYGMGTWARTFFDTFKMKDTLIGRSVFEDKFKEFIADATSKDSARREKASDLAFDLELQDKHVPELISFIGGTEFARTPQNVKSAMIRTLGDLKSSAIVPFLRKEYSKYTDSASIQTTILQALADQKSIEGNKAFADALLSDTPLSDAEYDNYQLFYNFYDSLEIASVVFPQLLEVTKYPEYKAAIYGLLSSVVDSGFVSPQLYAASKKDLIRQASDELKRQVTAEEEATGSDNSNNNNYKINYNMQDPQSAMDKIFADAARAAEKGNDVTPGQSAPSSLLLDYCTLLAPYYSEAPVKAFFDKAVKTKDQDFRIALAATFLKNKIPVHDSVFDNLAKNEETRLRLYRSLKNINKLDRMKPEYRAQSSLVEALVKAEMNDKKDSLVLMSTDYIVSKAMKGKTYFYKVYNSEGVPVQLIYAAFQPEDSTKFENDEPYLSSRVLYKHDDIEKITKEIRYELTLIGRQRVNFRDQNGYDYSELAYGMQE